jgi:hypothetical protein
MKINYPAPAVDTKKTPLTTGAEEAIHLYDLSNMLNNPQQAVTIIINSRVTGQG